jgi:hypothetical protein
MLYLKVSFGELERQGVAICKGRPIMLPVVQQKLHARSVAVLLRLESGLPRIMTWWLVVALLASALRIVTSPMRGYMPDFSTIFPYVLLTCAPLVSMGLALRWFHAGDRFPQPPAWLPTIGQWRRVTSAEARSNKLYGTTGMMVSLMLGMLLNVPVRAAEYLAAMPALAGPVPHWLHLLHTMMTLDAVLLSSIYVIVFVAALRRVPHFPRLLVAVWMVDLAMQLGIAQVVTTAGDLPANVGSVLHSLLDGNVKKVMVSVMLWGPDLLLSRRINVTYRQRVEV